MHRHRDHRAGAFRTPPGVPPGTGPDPAVPGRSPGNRSHRPAPARRGAGRVADILRRGQRRRHDLPGSSRLSPRRPLGGRSASLPGVRRHPVRRTACRTQRGAGRPRRGARHESRRGGEPRAPGAGRHAARPGAAPRPAGGAAGDPLRPSAGARRRFAPPGGGSRQAGLDLAHPCPRGAGAAHQFRATGGDVRPGQRGHRGMRPELALHPGQRSLLRDRRPFARDPARPAHAGHPRPRRLRPPRGARRSDRRGVRDERPLRSPRRRYGVGAESGHAAGGRAACRQRPALRVYGHQRAGTRRERAARTQRKPGRTCRDHARPARKRPGAASRGTQDGDGRPVDRRHRP
ncbi:Uncharacterised protein [Acinetobacter baumannii]|nr:Uncharacterised protein [Acinetobacter baumannii]